MPFLSLSPPTHHAMFLKWCGKDSKPSKALSRQIYSLLPVGRLGTPTALRARLLADATFGFQS